MWWIILIIAVSFTIYVMTKGYNKEVQSNVTNFGGMQKKYKILVDYFTASSTCHITRITKSNITLSSRTMVCYIDYVAGSTEIRIQIELPILGKMSNRWKFQSDYPQEKMIEEIENYLEWKMRQLETIARDNDDFNEYIN